ncbi:MAG: CBS domain-containing protein [Candidatus Melainabacteria bacterium]|nr:CBS domain-containing protein [Candidatus Melainabacteria bacterium]
MSKKLFYFAENQVITIADILKLEKIRNIPVVDKEHKLVGLVTYKEIIGALVKKLDKVQVKDIMVREVKAVEPETPLKGAIDMMIINRFSCLPVVSPHRRLIGIITEVDLLKTLYDQTAMPSGFYIK